MEGDIATSADFYNNIRGHISYHEQLLKDPIVFKQYVDAIKDNSLFKDKIVMEIGSGTGIFSMLAIKAGAKHVYAWEPSTMSIYSKQAIIDNNLQDKITILTCELEEIQLPEKVDIIFSFFFGFGLLLQSLYPSFLRAKTLFLAENGITIPSKIDFFIAPKAKLIMQPKSYWDSDVYGYNYKSANELGNSCVETILLYEGKMISQPIIYKSISPAQSDGNTDVSGDFSFEVTKDDVFDGFVSWFDIYFPKSNGTAMFSTSPSSPHTSFYQLGFPLHKKINVKVGDKINGSIKTTFISPNMRPLLYEILYSINDGEKTLIKLLLS